MKQRRLGKLILSTTFIDSHHELMKTVMSKLIVVRAEDKHYQEEVEYLAFCEDFDLVELGECIPEYWVVVTSNIYPLMDVINYTVRFERKRT